MKREIQEEVAAFRDLICETRKAVGEDRIEFFLGAAEELPRALGAAMLFRSLNLGEAALACAEREQYEALALIARSLLELLFLVKGMGPGLKEAQGFLCWSAEKQIVEFDKLKKCLRSLGEQQCIAEEDVDALVESAELGKGEGKVDWEGAVYNNAIKANMAWEYRYHYPLLCLESHHRTQALLAYCHPCGDGVELRQQQAAETGQVYFGLAMLYCIRLMGLLAQECGIPLTREVSEAMVTVAKRYGVKFRGQFRRHP